MYIEYIVNLFIYESMNRFMEEVVPEEIENEDVYSNGAAEELSVDDEISVEEEAFMRGYNSEEDKLKEEE